MMHLDMLCLAERLVTAMEAMSQDVKNMSAYVYDISCSVSYLLNERGEKEDISNTAFDEGDYSSPATFEQYEQADERCSSYMEPEHEDNSFGDIATTSTVHHENTADLSSESNSGLTARMKMEEHMEVNTESHFWNNIHDDSGNNVGDHSAFLSRLPEGQRSIAGTSHTESAKQTPMPQIGVHSEGRSHKCSVCEKSFNAPSKLEVHSRVHSGERPYKCNACGKAFTVSHHLTNYMRSHSGECPYKCNMCGKVFSQSNNLTRHMRSHSGERPYKCNVCGKAFSQNSDLTLHKRSHTGEKPYQCSMCGRAFTWKNNLRQHMRTHTGEKPYRCSLCGMSFGRQYTLNQHMRTHSEEHCN